jgi:hypothetical protein
VLQGVHVGVIPRVLEDFQTSSGGIESSKLSKKSLRGQCLKVWKGGIVNSFCRWTSSVKEYRVHFTGVVKEESDGRNSPWRIREVPRAARSCRGVRRVTESILQVQAQDKSNRRTQVDKGHWITREFSLRGFAS